MTMTAAAMQRFLLAVRLLAAGLALLGACAAPAAQAPDMALPAGPVRFGVLPLGGAVESRALWMPLLEDMARALGVPVSLYSVASYEAIDRAIQRDEIDMAFLSAKIALDAVMQQRMTVVAQIARRPGMPAHRAVLLTRRTGEPSTLAAVLAEPERWLLARGDSRSVTGFQVPQSQLFLPRNIAMETRFGGEFIGTHQATALAVANGDADVATNNTTDFERFREQFPVEAARLHIVWESGPPPGALMVLRRSYPAAFQARVQAFLTGYGQGKGPRAEAEREVLKDLRAAYGYAVADDRALLPQAQLEHQLGRQSAMAAEWVDEASRSRRLQRVDQVYRTRRERLGAATDTAAR